MATRKTNDIITGNDPRLGLCFYYSPHFDQNIWRQASPLTGERTKKDPAFEGFRRSSNRLKQASPIAGSLYRLLPSHVKQFALYRTLTGEAIKMLKQGMDVALITETLKTKYINPLLDIPKKNSGNTTVEERVTRDQVKGMNDFTSFPLTHSGVRKMTRARRSLLIQKITEGQSVDSSFTHSDSLPRTDRTVSESPSNEAALPAKPKRQPKNTGGLIYLGRMPECKKLKIWLRPLDPSRND